MADPVAFRAIKREFPSAQDNEYAYGPWAEGMDPSRFEPLYKQERAQLREALELIAAQGSGVVGSTSRADAMASIAQLALQSTP